MTSALAAQQAALLQALWAPQPAEGLALLGPHAEATPLRERGLRAYRSNGRALAVRALLAAYPVVAALLGDENFEGLAQRHWLAEPPRHGDIATWGGALPATIAQWTELHDAEPYLADVARLEWALHRLASLADAEPADLASFSWLTGEDGGCCSLRLAPGAGCVASAWPVVSIVLAHTEGTPTLAEAGARLRAQAPETALVWREGWRPRVREALPGEAAFIAALQENRTLDDAFRVAPALAFEHWLAPAVQCGLVLGAVRP